jgi:hypothetical protein
MSCQNTGDASIKSVKATFDDDKFKIMVYSKDDCSGDSNEPATKKCETTEELFAYSSRSFKSFKVG